VAGAVVVIVAGYLSLNSRRICTPSGVLDAGRKPKVQRSIESLCTKEVEEPARLGDGCHHVFIDAGSNKGVHGRWVYEASKYKEARAPKKFFDPMLGDELSRRKSTCVFAFEPNPVHAEHQRATEKAYQAMGWRYHFMPFGVGTENGTLAFYHNRRSTYGLIDEERSFSMLNKDQNGGYITAENPNPPLQVPVLDFAAFVDEQIVKRKLPENSPSSWMKPVALIKMDIEGAEFALLPHMFATGALCKVQIFGELHPNDGPYKLKGGIILNKLNATPFIDHMDHLLMAAGCLSKFQRFDDESHSTDGVPYPTPR